MISSDILLPKISESSGFCKGQLKIRRKFYYLEKLNSKYYLEKFNSKNGRKFYYSQKLCFDNFFA
jgi:hypothetical protein